MAHGPSNRRAFTLIETLIAMAVFLLAMIFIAAIFPAAALVQKQTVDDVRIDTAVRSVKALLAGNKYHPDILDNVGVIDGSYDTSGIVHRFHPAANGVNPYAGGWPLRDRMFPASSTPMDPPTADIFWVPVIRDANPTPDVYDWQVFAFILQRTPQATYTAPGGTFVAANGNDPGAVPLVGRVNVNSIGPATVSVGGVDIQGDAFRIDNGPADNLQLKAGDYCLDANGVIYRVLASDTQNVIVEGFIDRSQTVPHLWYAPPGNARVSPCKRIVILTDAVFTL